MTFVLSLAIEARNQVINEEENHKLGAWVWEFGASKCGKLSQNYHDEWLLWIECNTHYLIVWYDYYIWSYAIHTLSHLY